MAKWIPCAALMAMLTACGPANTARPAVAGPAEPEPALPVATPERIELGRVVYASACARCHEQGADGAPVTGRREDWQQRSRLWQSVLYEHADKGYLNMPARGADATLSDREAQAAAEYMLTITHPEAPAD